MDKSTGIRLTASLLDNSPDEGLVSALSFFGDYKVELVLNYLFKEFWEELDLTAPLLIGVYWIGLIFLKPYGDLSEFIDFEVFNII